jgi:hypothetical protein
MTARFRSASLLALVWIGAAGAADIAPFRSDGCSSFPDGTPRHRDLWLECCTAHDRAYWVGGTRAERAAADEDLRRCVARVGEPEIGRVMLAGVRVGGSPYWPTEFRWGYGWPWPRGYGALSDEEREQVRRAQAGGTTK